MEEITQAIACLTTGKIIAFPTETIWGLGVDPNNEQALQHLLTLKGRDQNKGMILLVPHPSQLDGMAKVNHGRAPELMASFWPGPLTLVLPTLAHLSPQVTGDRQKVAVRHSPGQVVQQLFSLWPHPLVATSANPSGQPPAPHAQAIQHYWPDGQIAYILGRNQPVLLPSLPSTVLEPLANGRCRLLRLGAITPKNLLAVLPDLLLVDSFDIPLRQ